MTESNDPLVPPPLDGNLGGTGPGAFSAPGSDSGPAAGSPYDGQHYPAPSAFPSTEPYDSPGPYSNAPYSYPQATYAQPPGSSALAIASLVLGICGFFCITAFIGLGLGIGALNKINRTGQHGRGMAIAGIILSSLWILLFALLFATGHGHVSVGGTPSSR